jgi:hypothetical protein
MKFVRKKGFKGLTLSALILSASTSYVASAQSIDINIQQQSLASALNTLAKQSEVELLFSSDIVRDKKTQGLQGSYEVKDALMMLLKEHNLTAQEMDSGVIVIKTTQQTKTVEQVALLAEDDTATDNDLDDENIVKVVGKRVVRRDRTESIEPTLVYNTEFFQRFEPLNLRDMLKRIPGIVFESSFDAKEGSGSVKFRGIDLKEGGFQLLVNGRRIPGGGFSDNTVALENYPADIIKQIQVIRSPTAEFDSQGAGLTINLILKDGADIADGMTANWRLSAQSSEGESGVAATLTNGGRIDESTYYSLTLSRVENEFESLKTDTNDYYTDLNSRTDFEQAIETSSFLASLSQEYDNGGQLSISGQLIQTEDFFKTIGPFGDSDTDSTEDRYGVAIDYDYELEDESKLELAFSYDNAETKMLQIGSSQIRDRTETKIISKYKHVINDMFVF